MSVFMDGLLSILSMLSNVLLFLSLSFFDPPHADTPPPPRVPPPLSFKLSKVEGCPAMPECSINSSGGEWGGNNRNSPDRPPR